MSDESVSNQLDRLNQVLTDRAGRVTVHDDLDAILASPQFADNHQNLRRRHRC